MKLRRFQFFNTKSKFNLDILKKKIKIFGFPCFSTYEDHSIDVSITNVGLILTKLKNEKCLFSNTQEFLHNIFINSFK